MARPQIGAIPQPTTEPHPPPPWSREQIAEWLTTHNALPEDVLHYVAPLPTWPKRFNNEQWGARRKKRKAAARSRRQPKQHARSRAHRGSGR